MLSAVNFKKDATFLSKSRLQNIVASQSNWSLNLFSKCYRLPAKYLHMRSTKIPIIVPVFNTAQYAETSIRSVQNQTLDDMKIICFDNGSTDDSVKIVKSLQKADSKIKKLI